MSEKKPTPPELAAQIRAMNPRKRDVPLLKPDGKRAAKQAASFAERQAIKERTEIIETALLALVKYGGGRIVVPRVGINGLGPRDSLCIEVTDEGIVLRYALDGQLYEGTPEPAAG